jgi:hypothetical protein
MGQSPRLLCMSRALRPFYGSDSLTLQEKWHFILEHSDYLRVTTVAFSKVSRSRTSNDPNPLPVHVEWVSETALVLMSRLNF